MFPHSAQVQVRIFQASYKYPCYNYYMYILLKHSAYLVNQ